MGRLPSDLDDYLDWQGGVRMAKPVHGSTVEEAALSWFGELGYSVARGEKIAPEGGARSVNPSVILCWSSGWGPVNNCVCSSERCSAAVVSVTPHRRINCYCSRLIPSMIFLTCTRRLRKKIHLPPAGDPAHGRHGSGDAAV